MPPPARVCMRAHTPHARAPPPPSLSGGRALRPHDCKAGGLRPRPRRRAERASQGARGASSGGAAHKRGVPPTHLPAPSLPAGAPRLALCARVCTRGWVRVCACSCVRRPRALPLHARPPPPRHPTLQGEVSSFISSHSSPPISLPHPLPYTHTHMHMHACSPPCRERCPPLSSLSTKQSCLRQSQVGGWAGGWVGGWAGWVRAACGRARWVGGRAGGGRARSAGGQRSMVACGALARCALAHAHVCPPPPCNLSPSLMHPPFMQCPPKCWRSLRWRSSRPPPARRPRDGGAGGARPPGPGGCQTASGEGVRGWVGGCGRVVGGGGGALKLAYC